MIKNRLENQQTRAWIDEWQTSIDEVAFGVRLLKKGDRFIRNQSRQCLGTARLHSMQTGLLARRYLASHCNGHTRAEDHGLDNLASCPPTTITLPWTAPRGEAYDRDRKREIDVFLQVAARDPAAPKPDRFTVYRDWLSQRLEAGGAKLVDAKLIAQRRAQILRRGCTDENGRRQLGIHGAKGGGPDVILAGELAVEDPGAFAA
jgi:hypothetical protein